MVATIAPGVILHQRFLVAGIAEDSPLGKTCLVRDQDLENILCVLTEFSPVQSDLGQSDLAQSDLVQSDPVELEARYIQFQTQAAPLYQLSHPQIPKFQWLALEGEAFYWVREYIAGKSCSTLLYETSLQEPSPHEPSLHESHHAAPEPGGPADAFSEVEVLSLLAGVLPTLHALHQQGVIHRNLSPASIIIRDSDQLPVLINFGLVKELVARFQLHPVPADLPLYSWGYTPPEQFHSGKLVPSSDLYALAMTCVVLLTGREPHELFDEASGRFDWERWVEVHPLLAQVLRQMLQPHPAQRFATAFQVMQALRPLIGQVPEVADVLDASVPRLIALASDEALPGSLTPLRHRWLRRYLRPELLAWAFLAGTILVFGGMTYSKVRQLRLAGDSPAPAAPAAAPKKAGAKPILAKPMVPEAKSPEAKSAGAKSPEAKSPEAKASTQPAQASAPGTKTAELKAKAEKLGLDYGFVVRLTDEVLAQNSPISGELTSAQQQQWQDLATQHLGRLERLPLGVRSRLGQYRRSDYDGWLKTLGEPGRTSQRLDQLADERLFQLFPEQKGKTMTRDTFGQVWYAAAEEKLPSAR